MMRVGADKPPLIVHIVHRFGVGGLENGVANLLNELPEGFARHCVMALTEVEPAFAARVRRPDVEFVSLRKPPGQTLKLLPRLVRELRARRPALVHTRNVAALECQLAAWLAGVPARLHGEHGWDVGDLHGENAHLLRVRRLFKRFVHHQIALSERTRQYLVDAVGVAPQGVSALCNGVDCAAFRPATAADAGLPADWPFAAGDFVVGTVGRLAAVKNQQLLVEAFALLSSNDPAFAARARLLIAGDGPDAAMLAALARQRGIEQRTWFAGERSDVPALMRRMDVFVLPSLAEGISNSILEAMASGRPVVATDVGGNAELLAPDATGVLVPSSDPRAMADAIGAYFDDSGRLAAHSAAARARAVTDFSLERMTGNYHRTYAALLQRSRATQQGGS